MARTGQYAFGDRKHGYTPADDRVVTQMVSEDATWNAIGIALDRSGSSVENRFYHLAKAYDPRSIGHSQRTKVR